MRTPYKRGTINNQHLYRFDNGYGASVVQGPYTYGGLEGLWELAVIRFLDSDSDKFRISYDTEITGDVEGNLTEKAVDELLAAIEALPLVAFDKEASGKDASASLGDSSGAAE